jgi:hypothetical protein
MRRLLSAGRARQRLTCSWITFRQFDELDLQSRGRNILAVRSMVHAMFMASGDAPDAALGEGRGAMNMG